MDLTDAYLRRMGVDQRPAPSLDALRTLHARHILGIPSSNEGIEKRERDLDVERILPMITTPVRDGLHDGPTGVRNGLYAAVTGIELNVAFCRLLNDLGFRARLAAAKGAHDRVLPRPVVLVDLEGTWLADVGTARNFRAPLALGSDEAVADVCGAHRLRAEGAEVVYAWKSASAWHDVYRVRLESPRLEDFLPALEDEVRLVLEAAWGREAERGTPFGWQRLSSRGKRLFTGRGGVEDEMQLLGFMIRQHFEETFGIAC